MTNKTAKRSLIMSVISLLLCCSMLIGTTFAWFTDTATTGVNTIQSGKLDVVLEYFDRETNTWKDAEGVVLGFEDKDDNKLWEPGCTYNMPQLRVRNAGNLALKYQIAISGLTGDAKLLEVVEWTVNEETLVDLYTGTLAAGAASEALQITGHMLETAGNEYMDLKIENISIAVYATQLTSESDSYGPDYDENAPTVILVGNDTTVYKTIAEAYAATGKTEFKVAGPIDMTQLGDLFKTANQKVTFTQIEGDTPAYYDFSGKLALNVNGASLTFNGGYIQGMRSNAGSGYGFQHTTGTITYNGVTINDSWTNEHGATVVYNDCTFTGTYYIWSYSVPSITFSGCEFNKEDSRAILIYSHGNNPIDATIENCVFTAKAKGYTGVPAWTAAVEVDASLISSGATVTISNCTADANYNGIVRDKGGKNATITVNGALVVSSNEDLAAALAAGETDIVLGSGTYTLPAAAKGKTLTIMGNGDTTVDITGGLNYNLNSSTVVFENVTINCEHTGPGYNLGFAHAGKIVYNNCVINGTLGLYSEGEFNNCTFNVSGDCYNLWTWGAPIATFNNCTFNSDGKALLLYGQANTKLTLNGCTFNDNGGLSDLKAAVEIGNDYNKSYELIVNDTVVNGYEINDKGINTGSTLWGNKNSMPQEKLNVVIDGVDVY